MGRTINLFEADTAVKAGTMGIYYTVLSHYYTVLSPH
jgi:hypothetical protein